MQMDLFGGGGGASGDGDDGGAQVEPVALVEAARSRYLNYGLSVVTSRALPDVRDGLKPVQRRILYTMFNDLRLQPDGRYVKSARVVGDVMGKYHPHGDTAIYDALVRIAQPFSLRYPLVDGQGNFGSLDGDAAAAMRYTEVKLLPLATELLSELKQDTVEFRPSYDATNEEPVVVPAQVPNLLVNGATGIAVGLATNIPPHNLREVIGACLLLIDDPDASLVDLCHHVRGPDFPTGGEIISSDDDLRAMYEIGQGPVKLRGTWHEEIVQRKRCLVIDSIPYGLDKSSVVEKIAQLVITRKVPQIVDVRDESTDDVRIVLELKRGAEPAVAMAYLYKHTPLQLTFHVNLTCLVPTANPLVSAPQRLGLKACLRYFLDFRLQVVTRRLHHQLRKLLDRIHILEGFELVFDALDETIAIIRASEGKSDAASKLMARFGLDDDQVDAILELRLYRLAQLEILIIQEELREKRAEAARLQGLLSDEAARWALVRQELGEIADSYGDERRTALVGPRLEQSFDPEAYIVRERTWVIISRLGRIKRQKKISDVASIRVPEGDTVGWVVQTDTRQTVSFYTQHGSAYVMRVDDIPATTGHGEAVQTFFNFADGESVVGVTSSDPRVLPVPAEVDVAKLAEDDPRPPFAVVVTREGKTLRFPVAAHREVSTKSGRKYVSLADGDQALAVFTCAGDETVALATEGGHVLLFPVHEVPPRGGAARGVNAIKLEGDDRVLGFQLASKKREGLVTHTNRGRELIVRETLYKVASRGGKGTVALRLGRLVKCDWPVVMIVAPEGTDIEDDAEGLDL